MSGLKFAPVHALKRPKAVELTREIEIGQQIRRVVLDVFQVDVSSEC